MSSPSPFRGRRFGKLWKIGESYGCLGGVSSVKGDRGWSVLRRLRTRDGCVSSVKGRRRKECPAPKGATGRTFPTPPQRRIDALSKTSPQERPMALNAKLIWKKYGIYKYSIKFRHFLWKNHWCFKHNGVKCMKKYWFYKFSIKVGQFFGKKKKQQIDFLSRVGWNVWKSITCTSIQ